MVLFNFFIVVIDEFDVFRILSGIRKMKKLIKINLILFRWITTDNLEKVKIDSEELSLMLFEEEMAFHMIMASGLFN